jgi:GT2 family glycosyltransferase
MPTVDIGIRLDRTVAELDRTIESIVAQTLANWRLLIIDDASSEALPEAVRAWQGRDARIEVRRLEATQGPADTCSAAIALMDAPFVVLPSAGDRWDPRYLERTCQSLVSHPAVAVAHTRWERVQKDGSRSPTPLPFGRSGLYWCDETLLLYNWIPLSFGVFRRTAFEDLGGFRSGYRQMFDHEMWLRMAQRWPFYYSDDLLGFLAPRDTGEAEFEACRLRDEVYADRQGWSLPLRQVAKASGVSLVTGMGLAETASRMANRMGASPDEDTFLLAVAESCLWTALNSQLAFPDSPQAALPLVDRVLERRPREPRAIALARAAEEGVAGAGPIAFSLVLALHNQAAEAEACLEALSAHTPEDLPYEVILVDDASTDDTGELLDSLQGDVVIERNERDRGLETAWLQGRALARGRHVVFLRPEARLEPGWADRLLVSLTRTTDPEPERPEGFPPEWSALGRSVDGMGLALPREQPLPWPAGATRVARVSVVIVSYNSERTLRECVASVLATLGPADEVMVVDNASRDGTPRLLAQLAETDPRVRVLLSPENVGFSAGCNLGIRATRGDYVLLLNPDTVVYPGWIDPMLAAMANPLVGAVGPISDYVAGAQKWELYAPSDRPTSLADLARLVGRQNAGRVAETKLLIGFCMLLRRQLLESLGLLDEELFLGNDDLDLSWRLALAGHRLVVATAAFVHHVGQVSFDTEPSAHTKRLVQESTDALARKLVRHYGPGRVPSAAELWGMAWFTPTPGILEGTVIS